MSGPATPKAQSPASAKGRKLSCAIVFNKTESRHVTRSVVSAPFQENPPKFSRPFRPASIDPHGSDVPSIMKPRCSSPPVYPNVLYGIFPSTGNTSAPFSLFPGLMAAKDVFGATLTTGRAILGLLYVPTPEEPVVEESTTGAGQYGNTGRKSAP